jgi:hypothetical protein
MATQDTDAKRAVPTGELVAHLARVFAAQAEFAEAAKVWLVGELPAPLAQLKHLMDRQRVVQEALIDLRGEALAVHHAIKGEYVRDAPEPVLGRWDDAA